MAQKAKPTKEIAQRIDPTYHQRLHPFRKTRRRLNLGLFAVSALWIGGAFALGRETVYANGPAAPSHRFIEPDCAKCHLDAFAAVPDAACTGCHPIGPHVPAASQREEPACAACHREHQGATLVTAVGDAHCNRCHEAHRSITSLDDHIQFEPEHEHDQKIRFSHARHLATGLQGGPLQCAACHEAQAVGRDFGPIRFEAHCARCHRERVAPGLDAEVPHGIAGERVRDWIAVAFVRAELAPRAESSVPGRGATRAPAWAETLEQRVDAAAGALFRPGRGCYLCHVGKDGAIDPPSIPSNWLPRARFDHKTHRFEGCATCHDMRDNESAEGLELPGVETCRKCHGPDAAAATCRTCHPYHPADTEAWR